MSGCRMPWAGRGVAVLVAALVAACGGLDVEQARICESLLPALEPGAAEATAPRAEIDPGTENTVIVRYGVPEGPALMEHWIRCTFGGSGFDVARRELVAVATDRRGPLTDVQLFMLRRFWLGSIESQAAVRGSPVPADAAFPYAVQQAVNGVTIGFVYALLAVAYTLVFALIARINLAFGELAMIGAYGALVAVYLFAIAGGAGVVPTLALALGCAVGITAVYGWASERGVFRPLRGHPSQAVLIATVGLAIFLQELVRLTQGARDRWLQPVLNDTHVIAAGDGFTAVVTTFKVVIVIFIAALFAGLWALMVRGRFGRAWRACADDMGMAALCGIDADRTVAWTFVLSAACAAVCGVIIALHYGGVSFHMGTMLGFKALTAAIVGGIGSLPGALVGGLLVGLVETAWSAYLSGAYRDAAVFTLLAVVLVFRPRGLFGRAGTGV